MKTRVISPVMLAASFIGSAHAQSSVTLYGIADVGIGYTSNLGGHSAVQMLPGVGAADRWGLLGKEDLGGGLKALFKLENGFSIVNGSLGQNGRMFGRNAYVGLSSDTWGTLTAGRQYTPYQELIPYVMGMAWMTGYTAHPFDNDDVNNSFRANNSVKYVSPTIAGLSGSVLYGFSNTPGQFGNNRMVSFGVGYRQGPLRLNGAYIHLNNPGVGTSGTAPSDGYYGPLPTIPAGNVARQTIYGGGAAYAFGSLDVTAMYSHVRFEAITGGDLTFANYDTSLHYRFTPTFALALGYVYTTQRSTVESGANTHYHQLATFAVYSLSKTTDIYANAVYQKAAGNAPAFINGTPKASSSSNQAFVATGLRKTF